MVQTISMCESILQRSGDNTGQAGKQRLKITSFECVSKNIIIIKILNIKYINIEIILEKNCSMFQKMREGRRTS